MDEFSWTLNSDGVISHNKQELYKIGMSNGTLTNSTTESVQNPQEGDVIGISYDHIQLKFYINGAEVDYSVSNVKGTVYPALYGKKTYSCLLGRFILVKQYYRNMYFGKCSAILYKFNYAFRLWCFMFSIEDKNEVLNCFSGRWSNFGHRTWKLQPLATSRLWKDYGRTVITLIFQMLHRI